MYMYVDGENKGGGLKMYTAAGEWESNEEKRGCERFSNGIQLC